MDTSKRRYALRLATSSWIAVAALASVLGASGCAHSTVDKAASACASYGLENDPYCLMYVGEGIKTRQAIALSGNDALVAGVLLTRPR